VNAPKKIDVDLVKRLLNYDASVGGSCLIWKTSKGSMKKGSVAGIKTNRGYWHIKINEKSYLAHRLVWAIFNNIDPEHHIDHINGDKSDSRIENLRLTPNNHVDNGQNMKKRSDNSSGLIGVSWHKATSKWVAQIKIHNKKLYLGVYDTVEKAHNAYLEAKKKYHSFQPTLREE